LDKLNPNHIHAFLTVWLAFFSFSAARIKSGANANTLKQAAGFILIIMRHHKTYHGKNAATRAKSLSIAH
jgi:hypothetical protein